MLSLLMLIIGAGCCTSVRPSSVVNVRTTNQEIQTIKQIQDSTVALVMGPQGEKSPYCAGVWVDSNHILTAAHCAEIVGRTIFSIDEESEYNPVGDIAIFLNKSDLRNGEIPQDFSWLGIVKKIDKKHDLALIQSISETSYHSIASLALTNIEVGETIHTAGHPVGLFWTYTRGVVGAIRDSEGPLLGKQQIMTRVVQVSAPIWVGNSGGGAFNTDGHLIGICSWITLRAPNIGFFIHRDEIKNFLESS